MQVTPNKTDRGDQFQIRVDHSLNNNQKLAIYYYFDDDNTLDPFAKSQASGATTGNFPGVYTTRTQQINATHTWTIGSTSVNEARFSYFREGQLKFDTPTRVGAIQSSCGSGAASAFCFTGTSDTALFDDSGAALGTNADYGIHTGLGASKEGVPFIDVGGGFTIGNNFNGQLPQTGNTYQFSDNFSKIIGNHSLKFGGDVRYQMFDQLLYFDVNGDMGFLSSPNGPVGNDLGFSDSYPDYFLGIANSYFQGSAQHELVRSTSLYLFAQDSWKIKSNLTVNYGVRWEMNTPLTDIGKKCRRSAGDRFHRSIPAHCRQATRCSFRVASKIAIRLELLRLASCSRATRTCQALSQIPITKDSLRGSASRGVRIGKTACWSAFRRARKNQRQHGLWHLLQSDRTARSRAVQRRAPFGGSNFISSPLLQTPYVDQSGGVFPNPFNGILTPPRGQPIDWSQFRPMTFFGEFPPDLRMQYSDQYNLTIKRQLPGDILFQVGYVGSQGHRLLASYEINTGNPTTCNQLNTILGDGTCGPFGEDSSYTIPAGTVIPGRWIPVTVQRRQRRSHRSSGSSCESHYVGWHSEILVAALPAADWRWLPG